MSPEHAIVLVAAFGAAVIDAMAGGGGLVQMPALFRVSARTARDAAPGLIAVCAGRGVPAASAHRNGDP